MYKATSFHVTYMNENEKELLLNEISNWGHITEVSDRPPLNETPRETFAKHGIDIEKEERLWVYKGYEDEKVFFSGVITVERRKANRNGNPISDETWHNCYVSLQAIERFIRMNPQGE